MQTNGHHTRAPRTLGVKCTKGGGDVVVKVVTGAELATRQPVVVVSEAMRNDEMRPSFDREVIRQVVSVTVGIIEEATVLDEQPPRRFTRRIAALPTERRSADGMRKARDGGGNRRA